MAETLISIVLITSSAKGSNLVFRYPGAPTVSPRYGRPKVTDTELDNPWRASNVLETTPHRPPPAIQTAEDEDYLWKRPTANRDRSVSMTSETPGSPTRDAHRQPAVKERYDDIFGYSSEFIAHLLCPHRALCFQKFELVVDDLAFLGHPVCADSDGEWRSRAEPSKTRGRDARTKRDLSDPYFPGSSAAGPGPESGGGSCQTFQLSAVLDLPDPSSSASGNLRKYFDMIYQQIVYPVTAVLFREQVLSNFVQTECDELGALKERYHSKGEPFDDFITEALRISSIARAMKGVYEAVKASSVAEVIINDLPVELQLPPQLDELLHTDEDSTVNVTNDEDTGVPWGPEMSVGWKLPSLAPWKSLLLLDTQKGFEPYSNLRGPHVDASDTILAEKLIKFLETASVTLSLADMATLLDWDLETHIYDTVRWLVHHRRAKVVDIVHLGLKSVFTLPEKFNAPLLTLAQEFKQDFPSPLIDSLPNILSAISTATSQQRDNHFFATVVRSKDLIQHYHEVVIWLLKRDMVIPMHLRIRIIATKYIKRQVQIARAKKEQAKIAEKNRRQRVEHMGRTIALSPKTAHKYSRKLSRSSLDSSESRRVGLGMGSPIMEDETDDSIAEEDEQEDEEDEEQDSSDDQEGPGEEDEDGFADSIISNPVSATPLQRRWLSAMSEDKPGFIAARFEQINQWFDGRKTDDEILFRADISRKELREILHYYEEHLQTFLHPP